MEALIKSILCDNNYTWDLNFDDLDLKALEEIPDNEVPDITQQDELEALASLYVRYDIKTRVYYCTACTYYCRNKTQIRNHTRVHTKEKPHHCSECEFRTSHKNSLQSHIKRHKLSLLKCLHCKLQSKSEAEYEIHRDEHPDKPYLCRFCTYESYARNFLIDHEANHTDRQRHFECDQCDFATHCRVDINNHKKKHNKYLCMNCSYMAKDGRDLKAHRRYFHYNKTKHSCSMCPYTSTEKSHLNRHFKTFHMPGPDHNIYYQYRCFRCPYKSNNIGLYNKHAKKHDTKKKPVRSMPFKCARCVFAAHKSSELYSHVENVHKDTYY